MENNLTVLGDVELVEKFQCPGCVCGSDRNCGEYNPCHERGGVYCSGHVLGTIISGAGHIALGLPRGFCRPGPSLESGLSISSAVMSIRLWTAGTSPKWDRFNIAVWALARDGYLFVRTYAPRVNWTWVDVVHGGVLSDCPGAIDVSEFYDDMD